MQLDNLPKIYPASEKFLPFLAEAFAYADISNHERQVMFLAQVAHESQDFTRVEENLNYSAKGLAATWPHRFSVPKTNPKRPNFDAQRLHRKPVEIANFVYANRYGNGDTASSDGWRYRGRGLIMTTFRDNYAALDLAFNMNGKILALPDMLLEPYWAVMSAASFWKRNKLNDLKNITEVRRKINGGLIGIADVNEKYSKIYDL